nr:immunoglobulin heavy chain junction region [Macaca mulatta]MOW21694.1 immunoglobulin heavy chain junction region [Macaca mulatta]MOW21919.1 immunoglobulin heavy chain junction region [Macaca mulatta]MOW22366.1 immunoglobulin heavy chain junction region [Macaca mulatta]MOW22415.1 immunoglobulin heavy chain junction region [Macaca mulatta]
CVKDQGSYSYGNNRFAVW